jgi:hypothetical protein
MKMANREEFDAAYTAWRAARDQHDQEMRAAMNGEPTDWPAMHEKIKELDRLHADWMEKSKPFVRWKGAA